MAKFIHRITLDLTPELRLKLEEVSATSGKTMAEALRSSISLYHSALFAKERGEGEVALIKDGRIISRFMGV